MSILGRFTRNIDVLAVTGSTTDADGNPVPVETTTTVVGHWRQLSADELGPDAVAARAFRVYLPTGTVIDAGARLDLGLDHPVEVVGEPHALYNPRTSTIEAVIVRAEVAA